MQYAVYLGGVTLDLVGMESQEMWRYLKRAIFRK